MSFLAQFRQQQPAGDPHGVAPAGFAWHEFAGPRYGLAALEREVAAVRATPQGQRNNRLNKAAFAIGQLVAAGQVDRELAYRALYEAGVAVGLTESEVRRTIASGFHGGAAKPRTQTPSRLLLPSGVQLPQIEAAPEEEQPRSPLTFLTVKELRAKVAAAGPRKYLLRGYWPHGDYGVHAGDMKAQKTWNTIDIAVSVASGTPWLGLVPVDVSGPVLMFAGEGGEADLLRRIDAVARSRGLTADDLPITVCCRAPHLSDAVHLGLMADELDRIRPVLTTLDPLYLAARGAKLGDLYAMGALLEAPQHLCQEAGSSLWVAHHQNRKEGRGAMRMSGAGPAEWGRVLISATVISRNVNLATGETTVVTELDTIGGSIPGGTLRVVRRIRAEDPEDLDSTLHYSVVTTEAEPSETDQDMPPARTKLLEAMRALGGQRSGEELVDWISQKHGHGLSRQTVSRELNHLLEAGYIDRLDPSAPGRPALWMLNEGNEAK